MNIVFISLLVLFTLELSYSQSYCENKYDNVWLLGDADTDTIQNEYGGCTIDFNVHPPSLSFHNKAVESPFQNMNMSSKDGELIYYSNGCTIYNAFNEEMENGDSLNPGETYDIKCPFDGYVGFQNMISLPDLINDSLYYVFHIDKVFNHEPGAPFLVQSKHAYISTIQLSTFNLLGMVIEKNYIVLDDTSMLGSPVSAVKTGDALGWWIITPDRWRNGFHTFKLKDGLKHYEGLQLIGDKTKPQATGGQGKFSPDGKHFAWYHPKNGLFLYDFNRVSGQLDNFRRITIDSDTSIVGGCEFSPSSQFVYVNHRTSLYQVDITANDIQSSLLKIADYDGFVDQLPTRFYIMERTPDNRIFMNTSNGTQYLHVIHEPNKKGVDCNFEQHSIKLPTINNFTFPHFPNYRLGPLEEPLCDSFSVSTSFNMEDMVEDSFIISPNPARDYLQVNLSTGGRGFSITNSIRDVSGRIVHVSDEHTIDLSNISPGIYFLQTSTSISRHIQITKFIKVE